MNKVSFFKSSVINSAGLTLARALGFAFTFVLAANYPTDEYGYVSFVIAQASLLAILVQPFGQTLISLYVSKNRENPDELKEVMGTAWFLWLMLFTLTLLVSVPLLLATGNFSWEVIVVFLGISVFYTYQGVAGGFLSSWRVLTMYLGSNLFQILVVAILVFVVRVDTVLPNIFVYGLSYFVPLLILIIFFPLPLRISFKYDAKRLKDMFVASLPLFLSQILYVLIQWLDVFLIEHYATRSELGVYGFTKTLSSLFALIPGGIGLVLLPTIAAMTRSDGRKHFIMSLSVALVANMIFLVAYLLVYPWFVTTFFGEEYFIGLLFPALLGLATILMHSHGIIFMMVISSGRTHWDTMSRIVMVATILVVGIWLVPIYGPIGGAVALLSSVLSGILVYGLVWLFSAHEKRAPVSWFPKTHELE